MWLPQIPVDVFLARCVKFVHEALGVLEQRMRTYNPDHDALCHWRVSAALMGCPARAVWSYACKHLVQIATCIARGEPVAEYRASIIDLVNYLVILAAMEDTSEASRMVHGQSRDAG